MRDQIEPRTQVPAEIGLARRLERDGQNEEEQEGVEDLIRNCADFRALREARHLVVIFPLTHDSSPFMHYDLLFT